MILLRWFKVSSGARLGGHSPTFWVSGRVPSTRYIFITTREEGWVLQSRSYGYVPGTFTRPKRRSCRFWKRERGHPNPRGKAIRTSPTPRARSTDVAQAGPRLPAARYRSHLYFSSILLKVTGRHQAHMPFRLWMLLKLKRPDGERCLYPWGPQSSIDASTSPSLSHCSDPRRNRAVCRCGAEEAVQSRKSVRDMVVNSGLCEAPTSLPGSLP